MQALMILIVGLFRQIADIDDTRSFLEAIASELLDASDFFVHRFSDFV